MSLDQLDTSPYLLDLDDEADSAYAAMRKAEDGWLEAAADAGCGVVRWPKRRALVAVPPGVALPDHAHLYMTRQRYASAAARLAEEQDKAATIGTRSTAMPEWVGTDLTVDDDPPAWRASRVRWRENEAWRGAHLSRDEVLTLLEREAERFQQYRDNAKAQRKKARAEDYEERRKHAAAKIKQAKKVFKEQPDARYVGRVRSGWALRFSIYAYDADGEPASLSGSVPTVGLVPVVADYRLERAPQRARAETGERVADLETVVIWRMS